MSIKDSWSFLWQMPLSSSWNINFFSYLFSFFIIPRLSVLLKVLPEVDWFSLHLSLCTSAGHCCCCSDAQACPTLCIPMDCSMPASLSFTISWSFLKLMSTELMMASNHLILCHPLLLLPSTFPSIRVFSSELTLHVRWPKYWSLASASVLPMNIQGCHSKSHSLALAKENSEDEVLSLGLCDFEKLQGTEQKCQACRWRRKQWSRESS